MSLSTTLLQHPKPTRSLTSDRSGIVARSAAIPGYVYAVAVASLLIVVGILWDIAWHKSIGRDRFLSPPHDLIYLGAIFAGLFSGYQVLRDSYRPSAGTRTSLVRVWGLFYSSLGGLFCIWGAIAMLTSAPFDNWWHSAYGLDIAILSPPHTLLGLGMKCLVFGAAVSICLYMNRELAAENTDHRRLQTLRALFILVASCQLVMLCTMGSQYLDPRNMHNSLCYQILTFIGMLFLPAFGRALRMRWGITSVAVGYFAIQALSNWILALFPAEPRLGPILTHVTHFQPAHFPLLIFVPAIGLDLLAQRSKAGDWTKALWMTLIFTGAILLVQYPFSNFLLESPHSRNWFFGEGTWYFGALPTWPWRFKFRPQDVDGLAAMIKGIAMALLIGFIACRISLRWGKWMQHIQR